MNQTQVLGLLASSKAANNMTATQSAQISQLASDTQVSLFLRSGLMHFDLSFRC